MVNPEYKKRLLQRRAEVARTPFVILVWGPGEKSESLASKKRRHVRNSLACHFGSESVYFSENHDLQEYREIWGDYAKEFYEALEADAIVAIAESIGSITELASYQEDIAGKCIVFVEKRAPHEQGFAAQAYASLRVEPIEIEEWQSCERICRLARQFAETLLVKKYRSARAR